MEQEIVIDVDDPREIHYYRQIKNTDNNLYKSPWGGCIIRNCKEDGELLQFSSIGDFDRFRKETRKQMWLHLKLKVFVFDRTELFGVFVCPECRDMSAIDEMQISQDQHEVKQKLCIHSRVASMVVWDWRRQWTASHFPSNPLVVKIDSNQESAFVTFIPKSSNFPYIAAVLDKSKVSLLFCATMRQEYPFCSSCICRKCHHYSKFAAFEASQNPDPAEGTQIEEETEEYLPVHNSEETDFDYNYHYLKNPPNHV